jgi:class 3 adenylate cyclase
MIERFNIGPQDVMRVDAYRASHRVALLAILFSDIVNYARLCESISDAAMAKVRSAFDLLTADCIETQHRGLIVKRLGDAVLAVFAEPVSAVFAALDLYDQLRASPVGGVQLNLRTGIHLGQVAIEQSGTLLDVFGRHVNRAARVQAVAQPGEILVTESVEDNVRGWEGASAGGHVRFCRRATHVLKGLQDPVTVYAAERPVSTRDISANTRRPAAFLILQGPEGTPHLFDALYDRRVIIGRMADCEFATETAVASRRHAMIWSNSDGYWELQDLKSTSGTCLNGTRVERAIVKVGDVISIGDYKITIADMRHKADAEKSGE